MWHLNLHYWCDVSHLYIQLKEWKYFTIVIPPTMFQIGRLLYLLAQQCTPAGLCSCDLQTLNRSVLWAFCIIVADSKVAGILKSAANVLSLETRRIYEERRLEVCWARIFFRTFACWRNFNTLWCISKFNTFWFIHTRAIVLQLIKIQILCPGNYDTSIVLQDTGTALTIIALVASDWLTFYFVRLSYWRSHFTWITFNIK